MIEDSTNPVILIGGHVDIVVEVGTKNILNRLIRKQKNHNLHLMNSKKNFGEKKKEFNFKKKCFSFAFLE